MFWKKKKATETIPEDKWEVGKVVGPLEVYGANLKKGTKCFYRVVCRDKSGNWYDLYALNSSIGDLTYALFEKGFGKLIEEKLNGST